MNLYDKKWTHNNLKTNRGAKQTVNPVTNHVNNGF